MHKIALTLVGLFGLVGCQSMTQSSIGKLRHVVLFKFKDDASAEKIAEVEAAFRALPSRIPEIVAFEWGTDVSVEDKAAGFTHCFFVTFDDAEGRTVYLPHPAHQEFVSLVGPLLDDALVFDFVAAE